jgi:hypothetical protein
MAVKRAYNRHRNCNESLVLSSLLTANPRSRTLLRLARTFLMESGLLLMKDFVSLDFRRRITSASLKHASNALPAALDCAGTRDPMSTVTLTLSKPSTPSINMPEDPFSTPKVIVCFSSWTSLPIISRILFRFLPTMKPLRHRRRCCQFDIFCRQHSSQQTDAVLRLC